jgi:hypothetical protein
MSSCEIFFSSNDWQNITFRLAVALLVGGVIGKLLRPQFAYNKEEYN